MRLGVGVVVEKNWALSVDQCWLQALQFLVHLNNLLSVLLRCNGFADSENCSGSIRPTEDHHTVSMTSFWCNFGPGKCFEASSWSNN